MKVKKNNDLLNVYKVTFVKNKIDSCKIATGISLEGSYSYQEYKGQLIYALIKAENEAKAREKANEILKEFLQ